MFQIQKMLIMLLCQFYICNAKKKIEDVDIIFTSLCCGYGKMEEDVSIRQIMDATDGLQQYYYK